MPHNQLRLQGGVIETETPVINQAGIAVSNRIRFKPDPQGMSLPEKLGGWAKFYASAITNGVVRALWGWQDTADNQWIALGIDSATDSLAAIQCTVNGATGLTSATGVLKNISPKTITDAVPVTITATAGSNLFTLTDPNIASPLSVPPYQMALYITNPISVSGIVLSGMYNITSADGTGDNQFLATDVLGNPAYAAYSTASPAITGVVFTSGTPHTLTISFTGPYTVPPGE